MSTLTAEDMLIYEQPGPRYTSYPTYPVWKKPSESDRSALLQHLKNLPRNKPLSLYTHIPFCEKLCHFCACNRIIDPKHSQSDRYLVSLFEEFKMMSEFLETKPLVHQLHWGGGTPTFLNEAQIKAVFNTTLQYFTLTKDAEVSIEVHPVVTTENQIKTLSDLGFNRLSLGVQDLDQTVQDKINRHQTYDQTAQLISWARKYKFQGINVDLVYGLPSQTAETFTKTVDQIIALKPDRLAVYSFAKVPWKQPFQRRFSDEELPVGLQKMQLYINAREQFLNAGYVAIGMDHFALPTDELAIADKAKKLHRNFMGYTTKPESDLLGFGVSSISMTNSWYWQLDKSLPEYERQIQNKIYPLMVSHALSEDDQLRHYTVMTLMCEFEINFEHFKSRFNKEFQNVFELEIQSLRSLEKDGLVTISDHAVTATPKGQRLIRNIAMVFDAYLAKNPADRKFSSTV